MGQSAGGTSVDYYSYTYLDDPIVVGLISHSGTAFSFTPNTLDFSENSFRAAASSLGCEGSSVLACMRSQDFHASPKRQCESQAAPLHLVSPTSLPYRPPTTKQCFQTTESCQQLGAFAKIVSFSHPALVSCTVGGTPSTLI